jgi:uncharacterized protein (DUF433 family)
MISTPTIVDVPLRTDQDGVIRIGNSCVTLLTVVQRHRVGDTPEEIHEGFSTVPLADIYAVIAYYLAHQAEVDAYLHQILKTAEAQRQQHEANDPKASAFKAKLRKLRDEKRIPRV